MSFTIRSGLVSLVDGVRDYFSDHSVTANVSIGWNERTKQVNQGAGGANRVVFTPSDDSGRGGRLAGAHHVGSRDINLVGSRIGTQAKRLSVSGPFALSDGEILNVKIDGEVTAQTITFSAGDFADISAATVTEVIAAMSLTGATVSESSGKVLITSESKGPTSSVKVEGGTANVALGFSTVQATGNGYEGQVRALFNWERICVVSVWAVDTSNVDDEEKQIEATETLFEWVLRAVQRQAQMTAQWGDIIWTPNKAYERAFGRELRASLVFKHPMFDVPTETVYPGVGEITKTLKVSGG